ncbi:THUMP domain-containing protein, partial [Nanoarchaeota archaeon]
MIIIRYSEIGLKGKNRFFFEKKLVSNIKYCLKQNNIEFSKVTKPRGRIMVHTDKTCQMLKNVFGISSVSHTKEFLTYDDLKQSLPTIPSKNSFRVSTQRLDKNFKMTSQEVNRELGALIQEKTNAKVDLKNADITVGIEIIENQFYLYTKTIAGYGGLPLGTEGKVYVLVEDETSLLAAWLVMKRGC